MLPANLSIGPMRRDEADILAGWAADEGWNPGKADITIAWDSDRDAFVAVRNGDDLAGGGTIFSYDELFGFMGLFIIRRDLRGEGLGRQLWTYRLKRLQARLAPGAYIGMDGVFAMVPFYERGGFKFAYKDVRFQGVAALGMFEKGELGGYGVARPARMGYKIGPLFASRPDVAERLVTSLMGHIAGEQVQLDVTRVKRGWHSTRLRVGPKGSLRLR